MRIANVLKSIKFSKVISLGRLEPCWNKVCTVGLQIAMRQLDVGIKIEVLILNNTRQNTNRKIRRRREIKYFTPRVMAIAIALAAIGGGATPSFAQEDTALEEIVTSGTRGKPRSATASIAPVDVISAADFVSQGGVDTSNLLRNVVPSFNVNDHPISDAATLVRPANLRGLAPDHTLLPVNGKRRHRAAVISWLGNGLSDGSQGPDISAIPSLAIGSVEILRDGAAAQYGSDAIAGVINFNLKNSDSEGAVELKVGQYSKVRINSPSR
jgi:iron complex outermembrane receptor protein